MEEDWAGFHLRCAYVAGGLVSADVLLSRLQRKSVRLSTARVPATEADENITPQPAAFSRQ